MDSAGERLKKARLEKGLSLETAAKKTKVHVDILAALEEDRLINMAPVYTKGFLKIYCEFLGVDPQDFIKDFKKPVVASDYVNAYQKSILPKPTLSLAAFRPEHFRILKILLTIIIIFISGSWTIRFIKAHKKSTVVSIEKEKPTEAASVPIQAADTIRLGIRARQDCWIKARVDGKVVFASVLKKGRFESWQAEKKIELSLGNAGGIDLELNGKLISPLGRKGQVIRRLEITKEEGLKILK